jgi:hypothetical protein
VQYSLDTYGGTDEDVSNVIAVVTKDIHTAFSGAAGYVFAEA